MRGWHWPAQGVTARVRAAYGEAPAYEHPYDLGACANLHEVRVVSVTCVRLH